MKEAAAKNLLEIGIRLARMYPKASYDVIADFLFTLHRLSLKLNKCNNQFANAGSLTDGLLVRRQKARDACTNATESFKLYIRQCYNNSVMPIAPDFSVQFSGSPSEWPVKLCHPVTSEGWPIKAME